LSKEYGKLFLNVIKELLERVVNEEEANIKEAASLIAKSIMNGGILHVVGAGHSAMTAEELFYRAGGLAPVNPIIDNDITVAHGAKKSTMMEGIIGYAEVLLRSAGVRDGDSVLVVSTSGVNVFPVEAGIKAKELGASVIAITSRQYSLSLEPRNPWGKRLLDVADVVIDNKVPPGDASLSIDGVKVKVGPTSTILNAFITSVLVAYVVDEMVRAGVEPPIWLSAHLPGSKEFNEELFRRYSSRIKLL